MAKNLYLYIYWRVRRFFLGVSRGISFSARSSRRRIELSEGNLKILLDNAQPSALKRVGSENDGGYLVPIGVEHLITDLFSPGTGDNVDFEKYFADCGVQVHMLDGSMNQPPLEHKNFEFERGWLLGKKPVLSTAEKLEAAKSYDMESWVSSREGGSSSSPNYLLQMDIEGHEWGVLSGTPTSTFQKFEVMVFEFHWLHASLRLRDLRNVKTVFEKLCRGHIPVVISANNGDFAIPFWRQRRVPVFFEVTLLRKGSNLLQEKYSETAAMTINDKRFRPLRGVEWLEFPKR